MFIFIENDNLTTPILTLTPIFKKDKTLVKNLEG